MKLFFDVLNDLFRFLGRLFSQVIGMTGELVKNPAVKRFFGDLKTLFVWLFRAALFYSARAFRRLSGLASLRHVAIVLAAALVIMLLLFSAVAFEVADRFDKKLYSVNIPKGYGASEISDLLIRRGIIDSRYSFNLMVTMFGLENRLQSGFYRLSPSMGLMPVLWKLKEGDIISPPLAKIVFPEGTSTYRVGLIVGDAGLDGEEELKGYRKDPISLELREKFSFLKNVPIDSLEGYLFPDTYLVPYDISPEVMRDLMLSRFAAVIMPFWREASKDTDMSLHEVLTLASIIEKEAAVAEDRPIISSVYHNRLEGGMYLAACPTVKYALSDFRKPTKKVYYIDLEVDSPYNTYKHLGLPPGPICNPGLASIKAAVYPAETDYLYFVARHDGTHIFSKTWQEHERAKITAGRK